MKTFKKIGDKVELSVTYEETDKRDFTKQELQDAVTRVEADLKQWKDMLKLLP